METPNIIIIILLSLGAIQGLVYGVILLKSTAKNKVANRLLATLLLLLSYRLIIQIMRLFGLGYYDIWYYVMLDLSWVHGTLLYAYVIAQTQHKFTFEKKHLIHLVPLTLQSSFSIFVRVQNLYWDGTRESLSWAGYWGYWVWMNQPTIYIIASALIVFYAYKAEKLLASPAKGIILGEGRLKWLKTIIISFKVYFAIVFVVLIVDLIFVKVTSNEFYFYTTRFYYYPFFIGISILTYWIGIEGFKRKDSLDITYKSSIEPDKERLLRDVANSLEAQMREQKLFKDPDLSLNKTADILKVKPYLLTLALSEILSTKFTDYVNAFRIAEVQALLLDPQKSKHNLLTLAFESGFNSKSSFNRSVNKQLGILPNELRKRAK